MADESIMKALDKVLSTYKAGGEYSKQRGEQLKGEERRYTAGAQQGLVSRGLSGTTLAAGIPAAFEQEVAAPYRTQTEMLRSGQEMQGLIAKAGFLESATQREFAAEQQKSEQDAAMDRLMKQIAANRPKSTSTTSQMSTFESRAADRKARLAEAEAGRAKPAAATSTSTQHVGSGGQFDLGYTDPSTGGGGFEGAIPNAPSAAGTPTDPFAQFAPAMDTLGEGGVMAGEAGAGGMDDFGGDQPIGLEDLAKMAEEWMNNDPNDLGGAMEEALPEGAVAQDDKWVYYEYYPGGPRYSVDKETGGRRL